MVSNIIFIGQKIEIQLIDITKEKGSQPEKAYYSRVAEILDEDTIEVTTPIEKTKIILLERGQNYNLFFYSSKVIFQATGIIVDRYKSGSIFLLKIKLLTNLTKFQRREYFRYSCLIPFELKKITFEEKEEYLRSGTLQEYKLLEKPLNKPSDKSLDKPLDKPLDKGIIIDISGGGIKMVIDNYFELDDLCLCSVPIKVNGIGKTINIVGKILTVKKREGETNNYEHSIQYEFINKLDREKIIRFIFEEERKNRNNNR